MLPTFLGIGAPKAGSTWLHQLLGSHPHIYVSQTVKEVRYFDDRFTKGDDWYRSFFPGEQRAGRYTAVGEISPRYLYCRECPERILKLLNRPRLILILRDTVGRAWSQVF